MNCLVVEFTIPTSFFPVFSWLIRLYQWKFWRGVKWKDVPSHVRIKFLKNGDNFIVESRALGGVQRTPYSELSKSKVIKMYVIDCDSAFYNKAEQEMISLLYRKYGFLTVLGQAVKKTIKFFTFQKVNPKNPWRDGNRTNICIEVIYWVLKDHPKLKEAFDRYMNENGFKSDDLEMWDLKEMLEASCQ